MDKEILMREESRKRLRDLCPIHVFQCFLSMRLRCSQHLVVDRALVGHDVEILSVMFREVLTFFFIRFANSFGALFSGRTPRIAHFGRVEVRRYTKDVLFALAYRAQHTTEDPAAHECVVRDLLSEFMYICFAGRVRVFLDRIEKMLAVLRPFKIAHRIDAFGKQCAGLQILDEEPYFSIAGCVDGIRKQWCRGSRRKCQVRRIFRPSRAGSHQAGLLLYSSLYVSGNGSHTAFLFRFGVIEVTSTAALFNIIDDESAGVPEKSLPFSILMPIVFVKSTSVAMPDMMICAFAGIPSHTGAGERHQIWVMGDEVRTTDLIRPDLSNSSLIAA